jgi:UDP-N-acetylglucosamine 1-carboxyvinyltransferase
MSEKFLIYGGKPLKGEIEVRGAKNATFPILAASILTKRVCRISNIPLIEDVFRMLEILESMGAKISWKTERTLELETKNIDPSKIKKDLILKLRGSVLFFGPLLARFGQVTLPQPGGCLIGARPISTHLDAFSQLGVEIRTEKEGFNLKLKKPLKNKLTVILDELSVTATENILLFCSYFPVKVTLKIADCDYQVLELIKFLKKMGVKIRWLLPHILLIQGQRRLKGAEHRLIYDPIEAGTFIIAAAATKGNVLVKNVELSFLDLPLKKLKDFGVPLKIINPNSIKVLPWKVLKIHKIQSLPYPGIPSDLQSVFGVLATQAKGTTIIHDPLYEGRLKYLEELNKMGAKIFFSDPHRAVIEGPTPLFGAELGPLDLRGGAALIIAGLIAKGKTLVNNVYQIDRGYEKIEERLQKLGANIKRIKD